MFNFRINIFIVILLHFIANEDNNSIEKLLRVLCMISFAQLIN